MKIYVQLQSLHLHNLCKKNIGRLILAHINISFFIRYKFNHLVYDVKGKVDVLNITETKSDYSFLTVQFNIEAYYTFRLDRNEYWGSIVLYVLDDIPSTMRKSTTEFEKAEMVFMQYV